MAILRRTAVGLLCVVLLATIVWALLPRPSRASGAPIKVSVAGITNDASGIRYATFRFSNQGRRKVLVVPSFAFENSSGVWRTNLLPPTWKTLRTNLMGSFSFTPGYNGSTLLPGGKSVEVTLCLPFDENTWRASFWYLEVYMPLEASFRQLSSRLAGKQAQDGLQIISVDWGK